MKGTILAIALLAAFSIGAAVEDFSIGKLGACSGKPRVSFFACERYGH